MKKKIMAAILLLLLIIGAVFVFGCGQKRPVIYAPDARIKVGENYDADDGVHALDALDGDLTDQLKIIRGKLNVQKAGRYRIGYEVINSRGYRVRAWRSIVVSKGTPGIRFVIPAIAAAGILLFVLCLVLCSVRIRKRRKRIQIARECSQM